MVLSVAYVIAEREQTGAALYDLGMFWGDDPV